MPTAPRVLPRSSAISASLKPRSNHLLDSALYCIAAAELLMPAADHIFKNTEVCVNEQQILIEHRICPVHLDPRPAWPVAAPNPTRRSRTHFQRRERRPVQRQPLGAGRWRDLVGEHNRKAASAIDRHRGQLVKTTGDGVLAQFDGAERAVRGAAAIRDAAQGTLTAVGRLATSASATCTQIFTVVLRSSGVSFLSLSSSVPPGRSSSTM